ncbi:MAG TPA: hypothetical protein EYQ50_11975 [Verrucomicrobiales bacterium]|nr:hypothetical protein [Verrucomicrobiales bacterium]
MNQDHKAERQPTEDVSHHNRNFLLTATCLVILLSGCSRESSTNTPSKPQDSTPIVENVSVEVVELDPKAPIQAGQIGKPGERQFRHLIVKQVTEIAYPGRPKPIIKEFHYEQEYLLSFLEQNQEGTLSGELVFGATRVNFPENVKLRFNSMTDLSKKNNQLAPVFGRVPGWKIRFNIGSDHMIHFVSGSEEIPGQFPKNMQPFVLEKFRNLFHPDALRRLIRPASLIGKPVQVGDSWKDSFETQYHKIGAMKTDLICHFENWQEVSGFQCASIKSTGISTTIDLPEDSSAITNISLDGGAFNTEISYDPIHHAVRSVQSETEAKTFVRMMAPPSLGENPQDEKNQNKSRLTVTIRTHRTNTLSRIE